MFWKMRVVPVFGILRGLAVKFKKRFLRFGMLPADD